METRHEEDAKMFKAFSDGKRLRILALLRQGEQCACVLMKQMEMPQSSLSYHMKILCEAGVVLPRQDGKWTHYSISERGSMEAIATLKRLTRPKVTDNSPVVVSSGF